MRTDLQKGTIPQYQGKNDSSWVPLMTQGRGVIVFKVREI